MLVSVVLPTRDRAAALRETFSDLLRLERVDEIVVVDDASTDDTPRFLASISDGRVRAVRRDAPGGTPAAKNTGVDVARGDWLVFAEDDCRFPHDFVSVLLAEAARHGADIVSAPLVHAAAEAELPRVLAEARRRARPRADLDEIAPVPERVTRTPLLQAPSLVSRRVLERVRFDESFGVQGYREESDFYLRATYAGFVCLLTPLTFFWEPRRWPGGCGGGRIDHARNNWRFLRRHGAWLAAEGLIASPFREQLRWLRSRS